MVSHFSTALLGGKASTQKKSTNLSPPYLYTFAVKTITSIALKMLKRLYSITAIGIPISQPSPSGDISMPSSRDAAALVVGVFASIPYPYYQLDTQTRQKV
jgi:hypothetical protein